MYLQYLNNRVLYRVTYKYCRLFWHLNNRVYRTLTEYFTCNVGRRLVLPTMAIYEYVHMLEQYNNAHFFIHLFRIAILLFNNEVLKRTQLFFADSWFSMSAVNKLQINFKIYFVIQQLNYPYLY